MTARRFARNLFDFLVAGLLLALVLLCLGLI